MISFRQADLLPRLKKPNSPIWGPINYEPRFGDTVIAHEPEKDDEFPRGLKGTIEDFVEEGTAGKPKTYLIKDKNDDIWALTRDQFYIKNKEELPINLIGNNVIIHDPVGDDNWRFSFHGRITMHYKEGNTDMYDVEDQGENIYEGLTRDKFDVED